MRRVLVSLGVAIIVVLAFWLGSCGRQPATSSPRQTRLMPHPARMPVGPPMSWQLQVRVDSGGAFLERAVPRRDAPLPPYPEDHVDAAREGLEAIYDFKLLSQAGEVLAEGPISVPLRGRTTYEPPNRPRYIAHQMTQPMALTVVIAIPFHPAASVVELVRRTPGKGPLPEWPREPAVRFPLRPREGPPPSTGEGPRGGVQ